MKYVYIACLALLGVSCNGKAQQQETDNTTNASPVAVEATKDGLEKAYFASGCFWCVEAVYESVVGVKEAVSGYAGGKGKNPTYDNYGDTGHAEALEVIYDPEKVSYATLVDVYFNSQDVTQQNGQGPDIGSSYRSIIFYQNEQQKEIIEAKKAALQKEYKKPIAAEVEPFQKFWKAEDYHQDYKKKHPNNRYIQNVSNPRFNRFKNKAADSILKPKYR